jgi:hypothetical protein
MNGEPAAFCGAPQAASLPRPRAVIKKADLNVAYPLAVKKGAAVYPLFYRMQVSQQYVAIPYLLYYNKHSVALQPANHTKMYFIQHNKRKCWIFSKN